MQFLVSFKPRMGGSAADNEASFKRGMQLFSNWTPPAGDKFNAFLSRADGQGGYALVETDNLNGIFDSSAKFGTMFEFEVVPVLDVMEATAKNQEAMEWRDSIR